jgi:hypothetical protein
VKYALAEGINNYIRIKDFEILLSPDAACNRPVQPGGAYRQPGDWKIIPCGMVGMPLFT